MGIIYDESQQIFHLQSANMSYVIEIVKQGYVAHLYWGKRLRSSNGMMTRVPWVIGL